MTQEEKSKRVLQAEERLLQAKARLAKVKREERKALEKAKSHHKFMMGGVVARYFPECYEFSEQEMNRIIACAFKNRDVQNMVALVIKERQPETENIDESEETYAESD